MTHFFSYFILFLANFSCSKHFFIPARNSEKLFFEYRPKKVKKSSFQKNLIANCEEKKLGATNLDRLEKGPNGKKRRLNVIWGRAWEPELKWAFL